MKQLAGIACSPLTHLLAHCFVWQRQAGRHFRFALEPVQQARGGIQLPSCSILPAGSRKPTSASCRTAQRRCRSSTCCGPHWMPGADFTETVAGQPLGQLDIAALEAAVAQYTRTAQRVEKGLSLNRVSILDGL